jgi:hypothetical protein
LVARTELLDIRVQKISGEVLRNPPDEMEVRVADTPPRYTIQESKILAIFSHRIEYFETDSDDEAEVVGSVEVAHLVELDLQGEGIPSADSVAVLLADSILFLVYPYVRAALQRISVEFGLPPVLLPYLRREPPRAQNSDV